MRERPLPDRSGVRDAAPHPGLGGDAPCAGKRVIEVKNPLNAEVTVVLRTMDERLVSLTPTLRAREERRYEVPGDVAVKEVFGRARPMMSSPEFRSLSTDTQVNLGAVATCPGFPAQSRTK